MSRFRNEESNGVPLTQPVKATVAAALALLMSINAAIGDDVFDWGEVGETTSLLIQTAILVWAVWRVPNPPR